MLMLDRIISNCCPRNPSNRRYKQTGRNCYSKLSSEVRISRISETVQNRHLSFQRQSPTAAKAPVLQILLSCANATHMNTAGRVWRCTHSARNMLVNAACASASCTRYVRGETPEQ